MGALGTFILELIMFGFKKLTDKKDIKARLIIFAVIFGVLSILDIILSLTVEVCAFALIFIVLFSWRIIIDLVRYFKKPKEQKTSEQLDDSKQNSEQSTTSNDDDFFRDLLD